MFRDRADAALQLAERLREFRGCHALILAIPRGGVPMGKVLADQLEGELDVVLVRKIPAPAHAEYAIGAIDEGGHRYLSPDAERSFGNVYVEKAAAGQQALLEKRRDLYSRVRKPADPLGRTVIIVDDGSATGSTMEAALMVTHLRQPSMLVAALGAAPPGVIEKLQSVADRVVCIEISAEFFAVSQFYEQFPQISDDEVMKLLKPRQAAP